VVDVLSGVSGELCVLCGDMSLLVSSWSLVGWLVGWLVASDFLEKRRGFLAEIVLSSFWSILRVKIVPVNSG
jgi:hypothetical protein